MAEDNPIEGLDPNQSAFEPILDMMDQNRPEDLSRTTTTTTLYISGDTTAIEEMSMDSTTTIPPVQPEGIVAQFRQLNPDIKVGDVDRIIPNATNEERLQIMFDYPEQFSADIAYNNKINSYVTQLKEKDYKDDQILSYLEQEKEGKRSDLMSKFPDLFDVKSIKRKGDVLNILESNKLSYSKLSKFGSEGQLKKEYPEFSNLIDQKKKDQQIQKDIKAQQKKVESDLDIKIKDLEKQLETGKNFIGQDMSPIDQETARKELRKLKGEQNLSDFDSPIPESAPISRRDIGKVSYSEPVTDFEFKRIDEFSVEPIVTDYRFVDKEQVDQELVFLGELNKNISATGGTPLSDQQINDVYVTGIKPYKESFKDYDDQLWRSVSGVVSVSPVVDLNDEFFERHGTTRNEFINKRKLILSSGIFDTNKLGETYYTEEEFQAMYDRSAKKINNQFGFQASIAYEKITGTNLAENPEEFYNESRKSSGLYNSAIDEDIVSGDSKATADNLRKRFGWLPYGSKDEAQNYLETEGFRFSYDGDNLIIQTTVTPEGKTTPELLNGIEINTNSDNLSGRIKNFMSKAIVTEDVRSTILEYERGEGRFNAEYNDPMRAAMAMSSYILSKPNVFGDANGFATDGYGQGFLFGLMPMGGGKDKSAFMRDMSVINTLVNGLNAKDPISNKYTIDDLNKKIQYAQYIEDQKAPELIGLKGHALAAISGVTETLSGVTEGTLDLVIDIPFLPVSSSLSDSEVNMLKESGLEEYQISDIQNKRIKDEVEYGIDEWLKNTTAVTDKSLADAGLTYELLKTMIHSLSTGAIVGFNPALVPVAFGLQTTARVENELKDSDLSNFEKRIISWPMATFEGILENFGLQTAMSPGKTKLFQWAASKALKNLPKDASMNAIEASMKYTLKGLGTKTILSIIEGGSFEALTEVGQEAFEFGEKNIVNMLLKKDVFKNMPDITTKKGADEFLSQLGKAALLGGLSGGGMSSIGGTTNLLVNGFQLKGLNKSFEDQYNVITSEQGRSIALSKINLAYQSKQITKEDAEARIKAMNEAYPLMMEIPTELSSGQKRQAYDLMLERKALEGEVKDKDKNLVVKQTDRIAEINNQLQQISKTDAIQEQETKEEVLPDEQSEMGLQEVGQRDTQEQQEEISPENSSNYANLTEDQEGNVVFFHRGDKGYGTVKPSSGKTRATSREEASAVGKVGGVAMYYTDQNDAETAVSGDSQYAVKVPKSKVYDANTDSKNLKEEAKKRHEEENPGKAFDANTELAYVTKIAGEQGYQMVVAQWDGKTRAQTTQELTPTDVQEVDGNTVTKSFNEKYESNKDKGFVPVIPVTQDESLTGVYKKIRSERGASQTYDELYSMVEGSTRDKYSQEQVTKMVNESDLSQEIKDEYNAIMKAKPESRRSDKTRDNIAGVEVKYPTTEQTAERKAERTKPEYVDNAASQNEQEDVESFQKELEGEFGMLTGENPLGKPLTEEENRQLNEKAEEWLNKKGYKPRRITGKYGQAENSFFVPGLTKQDAIAFAKEFNQESVAHSEGMIYQNGKINPRKKSDDNFKMEQYSPESDFVSVVNTKDGLKTFAVGYDFNKEEDSTPKPKPKKKAAPKKEAKGIRRQIENARKAIAKIMPGVEIVVHETEDSYRKATGETDSKKQSSRGEYNNKTKKIHINVSKANNRTVAHEVFHAILLSKVKTDQAAKDLTERMIKALSKNLEGMPEVKQALDAFAANYDENIQSEEKLAELVGILAGNYAQMNKPSQSLIKRFLDRLAKMFGRKTFTDGEVVDLLNTIAGKVAVGAEIEFGDINIIGLNGDIEVTGKPRKSLIGSIELKRFPVNSNTKVKENIPMSRFNGKVSNLFESDRMTGAFIEDAKGNPLFSFYGGVMYPSITGKWWASRNLSKAKSIAKNANKNRDKDGYIYGTPIIMSPKSHMSNQDMFEAVWSTMKHDLKDKKSKVTKQKFYNMIVKALSLKSTSGIDIDINKNESIDSMIDKLNKLFESKDLSFEKRKTITKSLLGDPKKGSDRNFPSAGSILEIAEKFEEPLTKKSERLFDVVVVMRTKGNLEAKVTPETDEFYHNSYPAEISSDAPIEMFILDGAYNITEVFPTLKKSNGETISWQDYSERHGKKSEKNARSQYGRTSKLSYASGEITTPAKRKQKDDGPVEPKIDIRDLKKKSDKKVKDTNKGKGPILRRLRRSLFDRQNDIKRIVKDFIPDPKRISKIINAIVTKAGASGYANEMFTQQDEKIFKKKNRLGKMVNLSAEEMTNLEAIIYARRIVAINENRRERGMNPYTGMDGLTEQDAIDNLNMMESLVGKEEFDSLSERAEDYFEAFKNNLKMLRDSGRITEETYNNLKDVEYSPIKTLKYIIPQDTMTDEDINNAVSTLGVNKKDIMKLSDMNENEILFDARFLLMMNTNIVVRRSFENKMLNEFSQGYESIDKAGKEALSDFIIEGPVKKVPPGFRKVEYFQDGVKKDLIMREDYARQLLDIKNQNNFLKGLGKMTGANILRFFATGGNPLFIVGNTAVDFANIAFFSDVYSAIKPLATVQLAYDFVKNFLRKASKTNSYENIKMEFMEHGGAMDFLSTDGLRMVQEMKLKNKILNKAQKALSAYARFMSYIGETGEMSFRLAVYERVKKAEIKKFEKENDRSPNQQEMEDIMFEAAAQSRETIDFSQGGTWVKQMDQALPYFNAAMQGLRRPLDYARKNPVGFTSNVVQYAMFSAGMTATSLGTLLRAIGDDDEEKKKVQDILDSISEYEKANYHIIFTGNKDKDGNYEYVRIKKLPLLSILGTATEQYTTKYFLKYKGIDYKINDRSIKKSIEMSAPLDVLGPIVGDESVGQALGGVVKRNPLAAAWLTYTYNEDTFTGEKVFYEPRDKKVKPYAEGLYDDKVNDIYKIIAPALDMSPKRSQAAVEKIITSESTNPSISIFYALTNGLFDTNADEFKENSDTFDNGMGHFLDVVSKKMVRYTNKNILRYKDQDKIEELEKRIDTDAYLTKIKIKKDIDKNVDSEILRNGDYNSKEYQKELEKLEGILDKSDVNTKDRPYYGSYTVRKDLKGQEVFKEVTAIIYERSPKMMAARLYSRYGDSLDKDELKELSQSFKLAKASNNVLKEGYQIYYKNNYLNKSQEEIDKFEETFGKIR